MSRWLVVVAALFVLNLPIVLADPPELQPRRTGRPGELTAEEEDRLDAIIQEFIRYDTGRSRNRGIVETFERLGPEAIPALIRGLNESATLSHSCPVVQIAKKLKRLLQESDDPRVLQFARDNIGAGLKRSPYQHLLNDLKYSAMVRKGQLDLAARSAIRTGPSSSPGDSRSGEGRPK